MNEDFEEELIDESGQLDPNQKINYSANVPPKKTIKQRAGDVVESAGNKVEKTGKTIETGGKVVEGTGKTVEAAGKGAQAAGKGMQAAGKGMKTAGEGLSAASSALMEAGTALDATGVGAIVGVPLNALGAIGNVAGKGLSATGSAVDAGGKVAEKGGKAAEKSGKSLKQSGQNIKKTGNEVKQKGKDIKDTGQRLKGATNKLQLPKSEALSSNSSNKFADKAKDFTKKFGKNLKDFVMPDNPTDLSLSGQLKKFKKTAIILLSSFLLSIILITIIVYMIFSPIMEAVSWLNEKWGKIADVNEKTANLYNGFGYQTTKDAFYDELDYLYEEYDYELDIPLLMATIFYKERGTYDTDFGVFADDEGDLPELSMESLKESIITLLKSKYKDVYEDLDEDGKNYTIGKIYRLRKLAKHQMDSSVLGDGELPTEYEEVTVKEYLERSSDRIGDDVDKLIESLPEAASDLPGWLNFTKTMYALFSIAEGDEILETTSLTNSTIVDRLYRVLKEISVTGVEALTVHFDVTNGFVVRIYKYEKNDDNYREYLKDYYIRKMPEFREDIGNLSGDLKEKEIDSIIDDIYEYSEQYKEIFGYEDNKEASDDSDECIGNIADEVVSELKIPVNSTEFDFDEKTAYGITDGLVNNGVDLTVDSAGIKEGDEVYSVYKGKIKEKTKSSVKISHTIKTADASYELVSVYNGLKSVSVKKDDSVKKGDKIGLVGKNKLLHFELHQVSNGSETTLNPTNLFIPCESSESSDGLCGNDNITKIWNYLRSKGYSTIATAGAMGNLQEESSFYPDIVQGDTPHSDYSVNYTKKVDKKTISEYDFVNNGPGGGGYGLAQWTTEGRKQGLYNLKKKRNVSIADLQLQLDYLNTEIKSSGWTSTKVRDSWKNAKTIDSAAQIYCKGFERPLACSSSRTTNAKAILKKFENKNTKKGCTKSNNTRSASVTNSKDKSNQEKIKVVFPDGVPKKEAKLKKYLTDVSVPTVDKITGKKTTTTVTIHKALVGDLKAALTAAQKEGFKVYEVTGYRTFASDKAGDVSDVGLIYSQHCYGLAVDINVEENCYKNPASASCSVGSLYSSKNEYSIKRSGALYRSFISNGWGWGGDWDSLKDYMHFSYFGT